LESKVLGQKHYTLLIDIVNNSKCFDRRDNTFLLSNRSIAGKLNCSPSKVDQLFRVMKEKMLVKNVTSSNYNSTFVRMLDPRFLFISHTKTDRFYYYVLYQFGDVKRADNWRLDCRGLNGFIDINTGELKAFNWYYIDNIAKSYSRFDRCYRKHTKEIELNKSKSDNCENDPQMYTVDNLSIKAVIQKDLDWLNDINSHSKYNYPLLTLERLSIKTPLSIYSVKL
jgi:hypothetical protein